VLKQIEKELKGRKNSSTLSQLSGQFYTLIPHDFGFKHMSNFVIRTNEMLKEKIEMI
jgi:poly [ADP-ribose] polymerase